VTTNDPSQLSSRRTFLASVGAVGFASLAGCLGGVGGLTDAGKRSFAENPVASDVEGRPRLGAGHAKTDVTLVAYFGPSCPPCASFHDDTVQEIKSEWIDEGKATMYNRAMPFVEAWARPATHALYEVHSQRPAAYWDLKANYYDGQDDLTESNLVEKTREYLDAVDVDVDAVTTAIEEEAHDAVITADVEAADEAGITSIPTTLVFEDGEFVTALGDDDFEAYQSAVQSHG